MKKKEFKINISGNEWTVRGLLPKSFSKQEEVKPTDRACTYPDKRILLFKMTDFDISLIRHELFHAFFAESDTYAANLGPDQVEEVGAVIVEKRYFEIGALSEYIYTELKK